MHPRLEEVLRYLDSERTELFEAVKLVPTELRDQSPGPDASIGRRGSDARLDPSRRGENR